MLFRPLPRAFSSPVLALLVLACGCGAEPDPASPAEAPSPARSPAAAPAAPKPTPVRSASDLRAIFDRLATTGFERGSCRKGGIRVEGVLVARPDVEVERDALIEALVHWDDGDALDPMHAAIVAGVLWDARVALPKPAAAPLGRLLVAVHQDVPSFEPLRCRSLKPVQAEGPLWNARGDVLALLARVHDGDQPRDAPGPSDIDYPRTAARAAMEAAIADAPVLEPAARAAFGDPDALHAVLKASLADLCTERTWKTNWRMRAADTGRSNASLLPLGQLQTGACDLLAQGVDPDLVTPRQD
jgi:hypothetical protein